MRKSPLPEVISDFSSDTLGGSGNGSTEGALLRSSTARTLKVSVRLNSNPNNNHMNSLSTLTRPSTWDPFRDFGAFENRLAKLLALDTIGRNGNGADKEKMTVTQWSPLVDISEDDKEYLVKAELPELKKEEVKVSVENGELTISGERKTEKEEKGKKYHRIERSYGSFVRSFTLPEAVSAEKVTAEFKDGLLIVHLPKDENAKPKAIKVSIQ
jgi:HSP20 family protein